MCHPVKPPATLLTLGLLLISPTAFSHEYSAFTTEHAALKQSLPIGEETGLAYLRRLETTLSAHLANEVSFHNKAAARDYAQQLALIYISFLKSREQAIRHSEQPSPTQQSTMNNTLATCLDSLNCINARFGHQRTQRLTRNVIAAKNFGGLFSGITAAADITLHLNLPPDIQAALLGSAFALTMSPNQWIDAVIAWRQNKDFQTLFLAELARFIDVPTKNQDLWLRSHATMADISPRFFDSHAEFKLGYANYTEWLEQLELAISQSHPDVALIIETAKMNAMVSKGPWRERLELTITDLIKIHLLIAENDLINWTSGLYYRPLGYHTQFERRCEAMLRNAAKRYQH